MNFLLQRLQQILIEDDKFFTKNYEKDVQTAGIKKPGKTRFFYASEESLLRLNLLQQLLHQLDDLPVQRKP